MDITETEAEQMFHVLTIAKYRTWRSYANFKIDMSKHAVEIQEKLNRQSSLWHLVHAKFQTDFFEIVENKSDLKSKSDSGVWWEWARVRVKTLGH